MGRFSGRSLIAVGVVTMLTGVGATSAWGSESVPGHAAVVVHSASVHHHRGGRHSPRVGGRVHSAWPKVGHAPKTQVTRWLARQVGATKPLACAKRWRKARARCHLAAPKRRHHHVARDAVMSTVLGDPGSPYIPDLKLSTGFAINKSSNANLKIALPQAGGYGLVALSQAQVSVQQMTLSLLR